MIRTLAIVIALVVAVFVLLPLVLFVAAIVGLTLVFALIAYILFVAPEQPQETHARAIETKPTKRLPMMVMLKQRLNEKITKS